MSFEPRFLSQVTPIAANNPAPAISPTLPSLALVMPCYNEARRLDAPKIVDFVRAHPWMHLILVNDGSTDETLDLLADMQGQAPAQITVLDLVQNSGKAEAVRSGLAHAVGTGAAFTGYWDADLATPLDAIPDFVRVAARLADVDVVFGSRRMMLGHRIERTLKRRTVSRLCSMMARMALRLPIADTQCGAKILRNTPSLHRAIAMPFSAGWLFDVELFARIVTGTAVPQKAFFELPLCEWDEIAGSKVTGRAILRSGWRMLGLIAQNRFGIVLGTAQAQAAKVRVLKAPTRQIAA